MECSPSNRPTDHVGSAQQMRSCLEYTGSDGSPESVETQRQSSHRNIDIYEQITQGMGEKGYHRDMQQCCVKIKELQQAYQKAKSHSGVEPQTHRFYKELPAILGEDPTTPAKSPVDTLGKLESKTPTVHSEVLDEEEEYREQTGVESQDLFLTPEQSSRSLLSSTGEPEAGKEPLQGSLQGIIISLAAPVEALKILKDQPHCVHNGQQNAEKQCRIHASHRDSGCADVKKSSVYA